MIWDYIASSKPLECQSVGDTALVKEIDHIQLLRTKLHQPPIPVDHVRRVGILARLKKEANRSAILISAPAGYGKTRKWASWLAECGCWKLCFAGRRGQHPVPVAGLHRGCGRTAVQPHPLARYPGPARRRPNLPPTCGAGGRPGQ